MNRANGRRCTPEGRRAHGTRCARSTPGVHERARARVGAVEANVCILDQLAGVAAREIGNLVGRIAIEPNAIVFGPYD